MTIGIQVIAAPKKSRAQELLTLFTAEKMKKQRANAPEGERETGAAKSSPPENTATAWGSPPIPVLLLLLTAPPLLVPLWLCPQCSNKVSAAVHVTTNNRHTLKI